jgi:hypothetical protein
VKARAEYECDKCGMWLPPEGAAHGTLGGPCDGRPGKKKHWVVGRGRDKRLATLKEIYAAAPKAEGRK